MFFNDKFLSVCELLYFKKKIKSMVVILIVNVLIIIIFECNVSFLYDFFIYILVRMVNFNLLMMNKKEIVMLIIGFLIYCIKLLESSLNFVLLKVEIEWNKLKNSFLDYLNFGI